jgi:CRP-like cAMP-binding protein
MHKQIIDYCNRFVKFSPDETDLFCTFFQPKSIEKKELILKEGQICNYIFFINSGIIRHFHIKEGVEVTCDIIIQNNFTTDYKSLTQNIPSSSNIQALVDTEILIIEKKQLYQLYENYKNFETLGRLMAESVAQRAIDMAMSLASEKPEERYRKLIQAQPELFQLVPQKHIANLLGVSPESLSRIKARG